MRIGFVVPALHGGGAEFVVRQWRDELGRQGHHVTVYCYGPELRVPDASHRGDAQFPFRSRLARGIGVPFWLRRVAARDDLDVLVGMMTFANLAGLVGLRLGIASRVPFVISERTMTSAALSRQGRVGTAKRRLARWLYPQASGVVAISHPVAADLLGGYGLDAKQIAVVPNPVVGANCGADLGKRCAPFTRRPFHLVFVGRLVDVKRPAMFVETVELLQREGHEVRGTVIGDGPARGALVRRVDELAAPVDFVGWKEPWWAAVPDATCLVLPSTLEGFGNVLVEAAARGIPSVAFSSALGVADAVVPGVTGELVTGHSTADLARGVLRATVIDDDAVGPARRKWLERFSVESSTGTLVDALHEFHGRR